MPDIPSLIQSGTANAWLLLPVAILLGALHALEPGHSKSMMTAFIVAIHGTAAQAALLALSATVAHTMVVWMLAILAWRFQDATILERAEPWLLLVGGSLIVILALRILSRIQLPSGHHRHPNDHHGPHHTHSHEDMDEDAHAAAHATQLKRQLARGPVTNTDVAWFGFSGGLYPCPAAFAVLLACFHQKAYALGIVMVMAFSVGLAITLVVVGLIASWGANALASLGLDRFASWAPYASAAIMLVIGLVVTAQGLAALQIV
jgi:nickel/cobalt exporter